MLNPCNAYSVVLITLFIYHMKEGYPKMMKNVINQKDSFLVQFTKQAFEPLVVLYLELRRRRRKRGKKNKISPMISKTNMRFLTPYFPRPISLKYAHEMWPRFQWLYLKIWSFIDISNHIDVCKLEVTTHSPNFQRWSSNV